MALLNPIKKSWDRYISVCKVFLARCKKLFFERILITDQSLYKDLQERISNLKIDQEGGFSEIEKDFKSFHELVGSVDKDQLSSKEWALFSNMFTANLVFLKTVSKQSFVKDLAQDSRGIAGLAHQNYP